MPSRKLSAAMRIALAYVVAACASRLVSSCVDWGLGIPPELPQKLTAWDRVLSVLAVPLTTPIELVAEVRLAFIWGPVAWPRLAPVSAFLVCFVLLATVRLRPNTGSRPREDGVGDDRAANAHPR